MYAGVLLPILSNAFAKKDLPKFKNLVTNSIDVMLVFCLPMMAGTWILGERIMILVAGPEFAESGRILSILIVAVAAIYLNTVFSHIVVAIDGQRKMIPVYIAVAIAAVIGYLAFIPTYGMWAAAWLTVASEVLVGLGSLWVANRAVTTEFQPRVLIAASGASLLMSIIVWFLRDQFVAIPILVGGLIYTVALYFMGGIRKETVQDILKAKTSNPPLN
jgi:O-antigen/teichoic acid export membrane protein